MRHAVRGLAAGLLSIAGVCGGSAALAAEISARTFASRTSDTDAVVQLRRGIEFDTAAADDLDLGMRFENVRLGDPAASARADGAVLRARIRSGRQLRIDGHAGLYRLHAQGDGHSGVTRPKAGLRVRWRASEAAPISGELRLARAPLLSSPTLLRQGVDVSDHRLMLKAQLDGPISARARFQHMDLHEAAQTNRRNGFELAAVLQAAPTTELALSYGALTHRRPAQSAYSAPRRVHTAELSIYGEWEFADRFGLVLDVGVGRQQVRRFGEPPRSWTGVLRLLGSVSARIHPDVSLELGFERNDSPLGGRGATPPADWRSRSVNLGLQVGLGS